MTPKQTRELFANLRRLQREQIAEAESARRLSKARPALARWHWLVVVWRLLDWWRIRRVNKMCREARRRMNSYTPEQRQELYERALKTINSAQPPDNIPGSETGEARSP